MAIRLSEEGVWSFLDPSLTAAIAGCLLWVGGTAAGAVKDILRFRRRAAQAGASFVPAPLRRALMLCGVSIALSSSPALARGRPAFIPRRGAPVADPPWLRSSGLPPPRPLGVSGVGTPLHPAIHGKMNAPAVDRGLFPTDRLFPRAGGPRRIHGRPPPDPHEGRPGYRGTCEAVVRVRAGDNLWSISAEILGTSDAGRIVSYWPKLYHANRLLIGPDPGLLLPGQVLEIPDECN